MKKLTIVRMNGISDEERELIEARLTNRFGKLYELYRKLGFPEQDAAYLASIHRIDDISIGLIQDTYRGHVFKK